MCRACSDAECLAVLAQGAKSLLRRVEQNRVGQEQSTCTSGQPVASCTYMSSLYLAKHQAAVTRPLLTTDP